MFFATLSIICKCGILGIGCVSIWCASGRGFLSILVERDLPKSLNWCSRLELRSHVQVRTHAHRQACARTSYYHDTQTKTKVDVQ